MLRHEKESLTHRPNIHRTKLLVVALFLPTGQISDSRKSYNILGVRLYSLRAHLRVGIARIEKKFHPAARAGLGLFRLPIKWGEG